MHVSSPDMTHSQQSGLGKGSLQQPSPVASVPEPGCVPSVDLAGMVQVPGLKAVYCNQNAVFCETAGGLIYRSAAEYSRIAWLSLLHMCTYKLHVHILLYKVDICIHAFMFKHYVDTSAM